MQGRPYSWGGEVALMMKPIIEERARANILATQNNDSGRAASQKSDKQVITPIRTDATVAGMAG
jgi:hypothetical protein